MFNRIFNQVNLLEKGLDTAVRRHEVISNNLANGETPNYDARHVEFETMMDAALHDKTTLRGTTTHRRHFKIGPPDPIDVQAATLVDTHYTRRMDGNNVDPDQEMMEMATNTIVYNALTDQVNNEFARLRMAIREGS